MTFVYIIATIVVGVLLFVLGMEIGYERCRNEDLSDPDDCSGY